MSLDQWLRGRGCCCLSLLLSSSNAEGEPKNQDQESSHSGTSGGHQYLYHKTGEDVVLACNSDSPSYLCSIVTWIYNRGGGSNSEDKVQDGKVKSDLPGSARLSVDGDCSLIISNVTTEDAGHYTCRPGSGGRLDGFVYLSILTISPSVPTADPTNYANVTFECTLWRYSALGQCPTNSILWVDDTGTKLLGEDDGYKFERQTNCVSSLTVKHLSSSNRRYTCQHLIEDEVKITVHLPSFSTDPGHNSSLIIVGPVIGGLLVLVVIVGFLIKCRRKNRVPDHQINNTDVEIHNNQIHLYDEPHANVTYASIDHLNPQASRKKMLTEDEDLVTYSAVRTTVKTKEDIDSCRTYSVTDKPE
ncbi:uncharacterized protein LOC105922415 isoform X2 [Fundulus heteroclitus]|nr:uncharacterized protein LOC105922415 isoform X2 [Fundulus heteroclitus]